MTPTDKQVADALAHAAETQPLECCGVIADGEYVRIANQADEPNSFAMDMAALHAINTQRSVEAIVHSHVYLPPIASEGDRAMCENTGLPWLIVNWPTGAWAVIEPNGWRAPLIGRQWAWGSHDCFGLIRDGFLDYTGILLPDFDRDWNWWKKGQNLIADHYLEAGFVALPSDTPPQHCDLVGMRVSSPVVNHLGLFLHPDMMLHQLVNRLSVREVYGGLYQRATELHLRHRNFLTEAPGAEQRAA